MDSGRTEGRGKALDYDRYRGLEYLPGLDGIRAFAVLMVITHHMKDKIWGWLSGGHGVTVFFVISGYIITTLCLREEEDRGSVSLPAFFVRRLFRIAPSYYLILAAYCALILPWGFQFAVVRRASLLEALPYYAGYLNEFAPPAPFYHSWALGVEAKYYLFWPLLVFAALPRRFEVRLLVTSLLIVGTRIPPELGMCRWLNPYGNILIGCLLGLLLHDRRAFSKLRFLGRSPWSLSAVSVFIALQFALSPLGATANAFYAWVAVLLLAAVLLSRGRWARFLSWEPLEYIGRRSYGMYLIHLLCINVAERVFPPGTGQTWRGVAAYGLAALISLAAADALYRLFEQPVGRIGRRLSRKLQGRAGGSPRPPCSPQPAPGL